MAKYNWHQIYNNFFEASKEIILEDDFKAAWDLYKSISETAAEEEVKSERDLYKDLLSLMFKLQWVCLPFFSDKEVAEIFEKRLQVAIDLNIDLWEKLKHFLLGMSLPEDRDKFKQRIREILNKNQAILTKKNINNGRSPTIENWIKHYTAENGIETVDSVKMQQFFNTDEEIKKLDSKDREKVISFFEFYEKIKLSSYTVAGTEEVVPIANNNFVGYISDGKISRSGKMTTEQRRIFEAVMGRAKNKELHVLESEEKKYPEGSLEKMAVDEEIDKKKRINELRKIADAYPADSLQRMAAKQEIEKIKNQ